MILLIKTFLPFSLVLRPLLYDYCFEYFIMQTFYFMVWIISYYCSIFYFMVWSLYGYCGPQRESITPFNLINK